MSDKYKAAAFMLFILAAVAILGGAIVGVSAGEETCPSFDSSSCETAFAWVWLLVGLSGAIQLTLFGLIFLFFAESVALQETLVRALHRISPVPGTSARKVTLPAPNSSSAGQPQQAMQRKPVSEERMEASELRVETMYDGSARSRAFLKVPVPDATGWYLDPFDQDVARYFNGTDWTGRRRSLRASEREEP